MSGRKRKKKDEKNVEPTREQVGSSSAKVDPELMAMAFARLEAELARISRGVHGVVDETAVQEAKDLFTEASAAMADTMASGSSHTEEEVISSLDRGALPPKWYSAIEHGALDSEVTLKMYELLSKAYLKYSNLESRHVPVGRFVTQESLTRSWQEVRSCFLEPTQSELGAMVSSAAAASRPNPVTRNYIGKALDMLEERIRADDEANKS